MPRFSILVPTRDRPATLRHTLETLVRQPGDDYEIVVADNCSGEETRRIVEALDPRKVRYSRCDEVLPMAENWERGIALCSGDYVSVLGDDDGFVPEALEVARALLDATQAELLGWSPHVYWWPDTIVPWNRNLLILDPGQGAVEISSREMLEKFYRDEASFSVIPMIYNAFFHRGLIEDAMVRYDGFFVPKDTAPDISSGVLGLHLTQTYVHSHRPLSIRGNSGKSNGTAQWARSLGAEQREKYFKEERIGLEGIIHPALVPSPNLRIIVASAKLKCRDLYFPDDPGLAVDLQRLPRDMVATLNFEPEAYEDNLRDAQALAARLGIRFQPSEIPPRQEKRRERTWGLSMNEDRSVVRLAVDGDLAGLQTIADAARMSAALLRRFEGL